MKTYKLLKDLPTFKAGEEFFISENGNLIAGTPEKPKKVIVGTGDSIVPIELDLMAYAKETLEQFPNILMDWFEEIKFEIPDKFEMGFWTVNYNIKDGLYTWWLPFDDYRKDYEEILKHHMEIGLAFETEEETEKYLKWLKARAVLIQDTKGFKPDWHNGNEEKYYGVWNAKTGELGCLSRMSIKHDDIYFETVDDIGYSFKTHEKEWKIYLGVEK